MVLNISGMMRRTRREFTGSRSEKYNNHEKSIMPKKYLIFDAIINEGF